jgi:hypothetical protein
MLESFHDEVIDPASELAGVRTLGPGPQQAAPGTVIADAVDVDEGVAGIGFATSAIEKVEDGDLWFAVTEPADGSATGGVIRQAQALQVKWDYEQTSTPVDTAIGTALLVDWHALLDDQAGLGPMAQTEGFGPRGVFHLEGHVIYKRNQSSYSLTPIGYGNQLMCSNDFGSDRNMTPTWGFMNAPWTVASGGKITMQPTDSARGGAGFVDNPLFVTEHGGAIDGLTRAFEVVSFMSHVYMLEDCSAAAVVGFDMHDLNSPIPEDVGKPAGYSRHPAGEVERVIAFRTPWLGWGDTFGIGLENGSRSVFSPQTSPLTAATDTVRSDASLVIAENTTGTPLILDATPVLQEGTEGQVLTLLVKGAPVRLRSEEDHPGSGLDRTHTLLDGEAIDLVFEGGRWRGKCHKASWVDHAFHPGVHPISLPPGSRPVSFIHSTTPTEEGVSWMDLRCETGPWASAGIRLFHGSETRPRTMLSSHALAFGDGGDDVTLLGRTGSGEVSLTGFGTGTHTLVANVAYSPTNPGDWEPAPSDLAEALDQIAARLAALE